MVHLWRFGNKRFQVVESACLARASNKKPHRVALAGFLSLNLQLTCASVRLERVLDTNSVDACFCFIGTFFESGLIQTCVSGSALGQAVGHSDTKAVSF